jgi:hypothetical protein
MPNQYRVLYEIYFQRPFKVKGPNRICGADNEYKIPYGTVRYALIALEKKGYIYKPFSVNTGEFKGTSCQVNESKCVPLFGNSPVINGEQKETKFFGHLNTLTPSHLDTLTTSHPGTQKSRHPDTLTPSHHSTQKNEHPDTLASSHLDAPYKSVSKFYKKLTDYIENSQFWKNQGVSVKKCESWLAEFYPDDPEALLSQLMFAEYADEHNSALQPKNKNKTPVDVFYGCLKKGGMTRPAGFEFPDERAARIRREELENQKKILVEQAAIREQEKAMADEMAFIEFLKDSDSVNEMIEGMEQKKRFVTPKQKISVKLFRETGKIDSKLEHALRIEFNRDEE